MRAVRLIVFSVLMLGILQLQSLVARSPFVEFAPFASPVVNHMLGYQLSVVPVVALALLVTALFARRIRLGYLHPRRTGVMRAIPWISREGRWERDAWPIALIMVAVIAVVTFLQLLPGGYAFRWEHLLLVVPFAVANALTEELLFRLPYVTMGDDQGVPLYGLVMGSVVFGVGHYWGVAPHGLLGAVMATILGFLLAKSIHETRGMFWACTIHCMLNTVGMVFILNRAG